MTKRGPNHGYSGTPTYMSWIGMKGRCNYPESHKDYKSYGGKGISYCEEWSSFVGFLKDMGERPTGRTLDRINSDRGYYKGNCRWATNEEQALNRSLPNNTGHAHIHKRAQGNYSVKVKPHVKYTRTLKEAVEIRNELLQRRNK